MPYWRLSIFYFFFFASLGALTPYLGLYLQSIGLTPEQIGQLMAILLATKIVSPNIWAWIADHSLRTLPVVRLAAFMAFAVFLVMYWSVTFWWIALVMFAFSFFWNAVLPQVETTTFKHLGRDERLYGRVRLWGSLGFIVFVLGLGPMVEHYGPSTTLPAVAFALLGVWFATLLIPEPGRAERLQIQARFRDLFKRPEIVTLLVCCLLMQASHAPFYAFFSIYLNDYGYTKSAIGVLWAFGVLCEIGVFYYMHRIHWHFSLPSVLAMSFVVTALRWSLVAAFPESVTVITLTQALHAVTFGAYHATALQLIRKMFRGSHEHRGIALYGSTSFGIGGAIGSFYSGYIWAYVGPASTFVTAAGVAIAAAVLVISVIRPAYQRVLVNQ
ncbi:MAG: MFS transporter [Arenicellales bacterium]|nr:MFS transporter [Arenicellales bacterium]